MRWSSTKPPGRLRPPEPARGRATRVTVAHLLAIQMAQVAERYAEHPEIKQLAAAIITTQGQEVNELKALKQRLYGTNQTPTMMAPSQMDNIGMLMPGQLASNTRLIRRFSIP